MRIGHLSLLGFPEIVKGHKTSLWRCDCGTEIRKREMRKFIKRL